MLITNASVLKKINLSFTDHFCLGKLYTAIVLILFENAYLSIYLSIYIYIEREMD